MLSLQERMDIARVIVSGANGEVPVIVVAQDTNPAISIEIARMLGGIGFITHLATIWPEHDVALFRLMQEGRYTEALDGFRRVNWQWDAFRARIWKRSGGESNVVKAALEIVGRPGGPNRPPTRGFSDDERRELADILRRIGVPDVREG